MQESVKVKRVKILRGYVVFNDMGDKFFDIRQINYITRFQFSYICFVQHVLCHKEFDH